MRLAIAASLLMTGKQTRGTARGSVAMMVNELRMHEDASHPLEFTEDCQ